MKQLETFEKKKDFLVCVDSDGCVMNTVNVKHLECFGPILIKTWGLYDFKEAVLRRWKEINLYSMTRGINRFKALALALEEIDEDYKYIEDLSSLLDWVEQAKELTNASLKAAIDTTGSQCLRDALLWSEEVDQGIANLPQSEHKIFSGAKEGLALIQSKADTAIMSTEAYPTLIGGWEKHSLKEYIEVALTQETGRKFYCIQQIMRKGYHNSKVLIIGDSPIDYDAAKENNALFYPIMVHKESECWDRFVNEAFPKFLKGTYTGIYQEQLAEEFLDNLSND